MGDFLQKYGIGLILFLAAAGFLAALIASASASRRRRETDRRLSAISRGLELTGQRMRDFSESLSSRQDRLRDSLDERMDALQSASDRKLEQLRHEVSDGLSARLGESFRTVNEQLTRVDQGLGEMRTLASEVGNLNRIMTNARARGAWGEVQLRSLLQEILAPGQYLENTPVVSGASERVEFAIVMPDAAGETALLAVDSKFPIETYLRLDGQDGGAAFERRVLEEAKRISAKYIRPPQTVDYALMFLPAESLYAEVARRRGLVERVQRENRVLICGPATLAALLTSLRQGFRAVTIEKKSAEVLALLQGVREEFARYSQSVARAGQRARQLEEDLNAVEVRARAMERQLKDILSK